jgi:hypothetical protein
MATSAGGGKLILRSRGSLGRRMILIATAWITLLLVGGGYALDRLLGNAITSNFDDGIDYVMTQMARSF